MSIPGNQVTRHCNGDATTIGCLRRSNRLTNLQNLQAGAPARSIWLSAAPRCYGSVSSAVGASCRMDYHSHGGQTTIKILVQLTDVANNSSTWLRATEGSQNHEVLEAKTTAPCNNKGDNANIVLGIKQLRVLY